MSRGERSSVTPHRTWSMWRAAFWAQVVVSVVVWLAICWWTRLPSAMRSIDVLFFCLLTWQCEMLGFWLGLGRSRRRIPMVAVAVAIAGWMASVAAGGELLEFEVFCWSILVVVAGTTVLMRRFAGSLQQVDTVSAVEEALQFGIQHLMIWTAVLAVLFGVCRFALESINFRRSNLDTLVFIVCLASCMSGTTVVSVWACLGEQVRPSRVFGMVVTGALAMLLTHVLSDEFLFMVSASIAFCLLLVSLMLLRQDRYRFVKRTAGPRVEAAQEAG